MAGDNERWAVTYVKDQLRILLVDGEPSSEPLGGEVDFLSLALSLGVGEGDAWQVETVSDAQWFGSPLGRPDLIVLANVATIAPERAVELAHLVESGTGLMIFVGNQVDPDNYNQVLFKDRKSVV